MRGGAGLDFDLYFIGVIELHGDYKAEGSGRWLAAQ